MNTPLLILSLLGGGPSQPPSPPVPDTKAEVDEASATAKKLTSEYVFQLDKSSDRKLRLEPEPVLRWINQLERRFYGHVYVWTHEGRPEVVASITTVFGPTRKMETEIHSLSTGLPLMSLDGKILWEPRSPGVEWKPLSGVLKPGDTAAVRLQQMRTLAAQFSVLADYGSGPEELRLLRTPIYRYESAKQHVRDGALFAYAKGTDPETFLLLEARGQKDDLQWQFAFARFNGNCAIRAVHDDKEVWQVSRLSLKENTDAKQPYYGLRK